jgi:hypothetical protein
VKIQEEIGEILALLSELENSSTSNIKILMHAVLIFKEQEKSRIKDEDKRT